MPRRRLRRVERRLRRVERRLRRFAGGVVPSRTQWHLTVPGADRWLERRWASRIARAPVLTPEAHAAAVADPQRRAASIEQPTGCPLCGARQLKPLVHAVDQKRTPPRWDYHVVRCLGCGLLYRHPGIRPERLGDLYSSGRYAKFLAGKYTRKRIDRYEVTMSAFGTLLESGDGRRLLDFGCGNGAFLELAHERGFDCYGVDLAEDAVAEARKRPGGRNAHHGDPADIPEIAAGGFDVITMWSVLAHLPEPVETLRTLRGLLSADGVLLLLTVNAGSLVLKRRLAAWGGFTPNHLAFFSPQTLEVLFRRTGFAAVVAPPWYGEPVELGRSRLSAAEQRRLRRAVEGGNRGNMLRAAAFVDPTGPAQWGLEGRALTASRPTELATAAS